MEGWMEGGGGAHGSFTFNESCHWPTFSKTRLFHIARIIRASYYGKQFVRARKQRVVIFWHFKEQGFFFSSFLVCSSISVILNETQRNKQK